MGLLDGSPFDSSGTLSPQWAGVLGSLAALGQSPGIAPQPASRLPLARPNALSILGSEAQGYLGGRQAAATLGGTQADTAAKNLANLTNLQNYNLTAPYFNQPTISMSDLQAGKFDNKTMQTAQTVQPASSQSAPSQNPISKLLSGIFEGGSSQPAAQPQSQQQPAVPQPSMQVAQAAPTQSAPTSLLNGGGGSPTAPTQNPSTPQAGTGLLGGNGMPQAPNAVVQHRLNQLLFGANLTPVQNAIIAQGGDPYDPKYAPLLADEAAKAAGINPYQGGERPGQPLRHYNTATGTYDTVAMNPNAPPGFNPVPLPGGGYNYVAPSGLIAGEGAIAGAKKGAETRAEQSVLFPGSTGAGGGAGGGRGPAIVPQGGGASSGSAKNAPAVTPQQATFTGKDLATPQGTTVPNPRGNQTLPSPGESPDAVKRNSELLDGWNKSRPQVESLLGRLDQLSQLYSETPTGSLTETKAKASALLRGIGAPGIADQVMSAHDTANVQQSIYLGLQEVMAQLKTANTGAGGRILNSEFQAYVNAAISPNLQGEALHGAITKVMGSGYQQLNMMNDWFGGAKQLGWRDIAAEQYQNSWMRKNPLNGFVDYAEKAVPPFASQPQGASAQNQPSAQDIVDELRKRGVVK